MLRGEGYERSVDALSEEERSRCDQLVSQYLHSSHDPSSTLNPGEMAKIQLCFRLLRERVLSGGGGGGGGGGAGRPPMSAPQQGGDGGGDDEVKRLKMQLQQRDHEINILVSMLNKNGGSAGTAAGGGACGAAALAAANGSSCGLSMGQSLPPIGRNGAAVAAGGADPQQQYARSLGGPGGGAAYEPPVPTGEELMAKRERVQKSVAAVGASGTEEAEALLARNAAFEAFRRSYRKNQVIEENKLLLKGKYEEAKSLGERVNGHRTQINSLKSKIEAARRERAVADVAEGGDGGAEGAPSPEEEKLKIQLEDGKRSYKEGFAKLKELKSEIEHLQHLLEQSRRKLQQDFEGWYAKHPQSQGNGNGGGEMQQGMSMMPPQGFAASMPPPQQQSQPMMMQPPPQQQHEELVMPPMRASIGGGGGGPPASPVRSRPAPPACNQPAWASPARPTKGAAPPPPPMPPAGGGAVGQPMLTGQPEVDAEIMAFYNARDSLVKARMAKEAAKK